MSKGDRTTTTTTGPPPQVAAAYNTLMQRAQTTSQEPWVPFTGEAVAQFTPEQLTGVQGVNTYANAAQPYYGLAGATMAGAGEPLTWDQIQNYYSPYAQNVIDKTQAQFDLMNKQALNNISGNAASRGALGGDRTDVAKDAYYGATLPGQEQTIAGMYDKAYTDAVNRAVQQYQQNPVAFGLAMGNLGTGAQQAGLQGSTAQFAMGQQEQQTQQQQDYFNISQYLAKQGYDFQTAQWLAGIMTGVGSQMGGTSTTTGPAPNTAGQLLGGAGALLGGTGMFMSGYNSKDGGRVVRGYQEGGSPMLPSPGGGVPPGLGGSPFASTTYIPQASIARGPGPPHPPATPKSDSSNDILKNASNLASSMGKFGKGLGSFGDDEATTASGEMFNPTTGSYLLEGEGGPSAAASIAEGAGPAAALPEEAASSVAGLEGLGGIGEALGGLGGLGAEAFGGIGEMFAGLGSALGIGEGAAELLPLLLLAKKGGRINLPGGMSLPGHNRINMPMRGGLGMPTFVRGYEEGGSPTANNYVFKNWPFAKDSPDNIEVDPDQEPRGVLAANMVPTERIVADVPMPRARPSGLDVADIPDVITRGPDRGGVAVRPSRALGFSPEPGSRAEPAEPEPSPERPVVSPKLAPSKRPQIVPGQGRPGWLGMSPEFWASLTAGSLGTLAAASRPGATTLGSIGEGGLAGLGAYSGLKKSEADIEMASRRLDQQAQHEANRVAEASRPYREMTAYQKATSQQESIQVIPGVTTKDGHPIAINKKRPNDPPYDMVTRKPLTEEERAGVQTGGWKPYPGVLTEGGDPVLKNDRGELRNASTQELLPAGTKLVDSKNVVINGTSLDARSAQMAEGDVKSAYAGTSFRDSKARQQIYDNTVHKLIDSGMTPEDAGKYLSAQVQAYNATGSGLTAEARTAGVREANLKMILKATDAAIPAALEQSRNVGRIGFTPLDRLIVNGKVAGNNADEVTFGMANLQLAEHWARAMNPTGQMRESDRDLALGFLSTARNQATYEASVMQLKKQIDRELYAVSAIKGRGGFDAKVGSGTVTGDQAVNEIKSAVKSGGVGEATKPQTVERMGPDGKTYTYTLGADGKYH